MNIKKFGIAFGIILLYIGLSNAESIIFYFIKTGSNLIDNIYLLLMSTINLVIMLVITRRHWKDEWQKFRENKKKMMPASLKYWLIGFAFMFVTNLPTGLPSALYSAKVPYEPALVIMLPS